MTDQLARSIAIQVLTHANAWYVSSTAHQQESVIQSATKTVLATVATHENPLHPGYYPSVPVAGKSQPTPTSPA